MFQLEVGLGRGMHILNMNQNMMKGPDTKLRKKKNYHNFTDFALRHLSSEAERDGETLSGRERASVVFTLMHLKTIDCESVLFCSTVGKGSWGCTKWRIHFVLLVGELACKEGSGRLLKCSVFRGATTKKYPKSTLNLKSSRRHVGRSLARKKLVWYQAS